MWDLISNSWGRAMDTNKAPSLDEQEILTPEQYAVKLQIGRSTLFNWLAQGILIEGEHYFRVGRILVQHTIVRGKENDTPKTLYRIRKIPITQAIRKQLDTLLARNHGDKLVTTKSGTYFNPANFRKDIWEKAGKASGINDKVPYSMRHSFAAWALTLQIDLNRLVRLMGHGSKKMIYEVYGDYIEGLEEDFWKILEYFGKDFVEPKKNLFPNALEYQGEQAMVVPFKRIG